MTETEQRLVEGLREAVDALYNCRYSEQPLAKKLDGLLKELTGKSRDDLAWDWIAAKTGGAAP